MFKQVMVTVCALLLISAAAQAASSKYYMDSGDCQPGSPQAGWFCVVEIDGQGRPVQDWGRDCQGTWYHHHFDIHTTSSDPTNGASATFTDMGDNGVTWLFVSTAHDANNMLMSCAGKDANGDYWQATTIQ